MAGVHIERGQIAVTTQVALLRGVNVGRHKQVPMAALRELLTGLGYADVRTYLRSGNAMFTSTTHTAARDIEAAISRDMGLDVRVLVRTRAELAAVVAGNDLLGEATDTARLLVTFLSAAPDPDALRELDPRDFAPDRFAIGAREIYLWCPNGVLATRLGNAFWERALGVTATTRNWNTVTKLLELTGRADQEH